jgi:hypothetical protein
MVTLDRDPGLLEVLPELRETHHGLATRAPNNVAGDEGAHLIAPSITW